MSYTDMYRKLAQSMAKQTGASTTDTFQDSEEAATVAAASNPCLVPEMSNELYDCCGSDTIEATCTAFGSLNAIVLGLIFTSWVFLMFKNEWFRHQLLLSFTFLFQLLPAVWRTYFYLSAGFKGTSPGEYIVIRSSDSGDFVVSLVAFAMYLYQL